jgi:beta-phosphoglucomutase-like phosphatase (HAD superfamily)
VRSTRSSEKKYLLLDHDGVLVDTEPWYFTAGERALAEIGFTLDRDQYLQDMSRGLGTWARARAAGVDEHTISQQRKVRDDYYREYLRTEAIEIEGVVEALAELSAYVRLAIVTRPSGWTSSSSTSTDGSRSSWTSCWSARTTSTPSRTLSPT